MIKAIFIDMDDTLIVNHVLYEHAANLLCGYLRNFGVSLEESKAAVDATDKEHYKTFGFSRKRYPATFEAVLKQFVPDADAEMVSIVRDLAETVFTTVAKEKPGISDAINVLTAKYPVYIVTQGDVTVQTKRLALLSFRDKLSGEYVVQKKCKETYAELVAELGYQPDEVVMMGDSLRSDIVASIAAGLSAIWVEADNWSIEAVNELPKERMYKFSSVLEAAKHLSANDNLAPTEQKAPEARKPAPPKLG